MQEKAYPAFKPVFWLSAIFFIIGGLYLLYQARKDKKDFNQVTGQITLLAKTHPGFPYRSDPKDRYIKITGYEKTFKIYLGGDPSDFLPELESFSELKIGDTITVYYGDDLFAAFTRDDGKKINFLTQQIDKAGKPHYIRGDMDLFLGNFFILTGVLLACFLFFYKV